MYNKILPVELKSMLYTINILISLVLKANPQKYTKSIF